MHSDGVGLFDDVMEFDAFLCLLLSKTLTPPVHRFAPKPVLQQGRDNGGTRIVRHVGSRRQSFIPLLSDKNLVGV